MTNLNNLATREDHADTRNVLNGTITRAREDLRGDNRKIKEDLRNIGSRLEIRFIELKTDVINWMLILFMIIMIGIMLIYFKH
jgi:hypothetical protein